MPRKRIRSKTVVKREVRVKPSNKRHHNSSPFKKQRISDYDSNIYNLRKWRNIMHGHPCFIIGNAPSVLEHDFSLLTNFFTIGINKAYELIDPTILFWQDPEFWKDNYIDVLSLQAIKVAKYSANPRQIALSFTMNGNSPKWPQRCDRLHGYGSSGFLAAELAVCMGFTKLVLIGMDCKKSKNGDTDFYGVNTYHKPHTLRNCSRGLKWIKEECPVEVYSCGYDGLWPYEDLKKVVDSLLEWEQDREWYKSKLTDLDNRDTNYG